MMQSIMPLNVLLVEDDNDHAKIIEHYLKKLESESPVVSRASRLAEGINYLKNKYFDVVLLDLRLPDSDFDETLDRVIVVSGNTPIIVLSSMDEKDFARKLVKKGAQDFLCKSNLSEDVIIRTINNSIERKQNEISLRESEARNRGILESSMDCIISINHDWKIIELNNAGEAMFGYQRGELIGNKTVKDLFFPSQFKRLQQWRYELENKSMHTEHNQRIEMMALRSDQIEFPVEVAMTSLKLQQGLIYILFIRDITVQKKASEGLRLAKEAAISASRAKSAFLANMSHEIRTPLTAILGFSELLIDPETTPSESINFCYEIRKNGKHLSQIIDDILDLSKVEAGKLSISKRITSINDLLNDVKIFFDLTASEKDLKFSIEKEDPNLKFIFTDPVRLKQILFNIIGNAIKFTSKGYVSVLVKKSLSEVKTPQLEFIIQDTGIGIDAENFSKLFTPFSQIDDSSKRTFGGTGLGLALSRQLARLLGGNVVLRESQLNKGSTFIVTIDPGDCEKNVADSRQDLYKSSEKLTTDTHILNGVRILVADDAAENRLIISLMLKRMGAIVDLVNNGKEAVDRVHSQNYDLLLFDIQMPVMDGYEAVSILRSEKYQGPILAVTAHAQEEDKKKCLESGFDDCISKPVTRNILIKKAIDFLDKS